MGRAVAQRCCSRCGNESWDRYLGNYGNDCTAKGREGMKCDTNGTEIDEDGHRM